MSLRKGSLISGDAGHNCSPDSGAVGYKSEDKLTKEVWNLVQAKLRNLGYSVKDCTPWGRRFRGVMNSLRYRVNQANKSRSALHLCIHFNAGGGHGVECWIAGRGGQAERYARSICSEISKLGYFNRGIKTGNLYIPRATKMPCVLIECSFLDSRSDMNRYNGEALANAIVKAVTGSSSSATSTPTTSKPSKPKVPSNIKNGENATIVNDWLYVRDKSGNKIPGRIDIGDKVQVLEVLHSSQLALIKYPTSKGTRTEYATNATSCISYYYEDEYKNGSTKEIVYSDSSLKNAIGYLSPWEKATPLYRKNGSLCIVYSTSKGKNTKSGFVRYNGGFSKF